jgi:ABC-2 type transport system ATP-binding protein
MSMTSSTLANAIEVEHLTKTYPGGVEAVRGVDFHIRPGEVFGLLGPNGAGKSTTVGMLTTTIAPTSGRAWLAGHDVIRDPIAARQASGVVFQEAVVDQSLTGRRNLSIHARLWGMDRRAIPSRLDEVIFGFDLNAIIDRPVSTYSGGQRRRLEIARALVTRPEVLFLDEPTVGLDPRMRYELLDVISGLRVTAATTILLTTHYLDEAERLCDRVAIVHEGRVIADGTPLALRQRLGEQIVELRVEGEPDQALQRLRAGGLAGADAFAVGATVTVPVHDRPAQSAIADMTELGLARSEVTVRRPTLDDVYLSLTGDRLAA